MKVLFLYTELADYIRNCFNRLSERGHQVLVVAYPVNPEAPFEFDSSPSNVSYFDRSKFNDDKILNLISNEKPDAIFCSGWIDSGYNRVMDRSKSECKTILISDNALDRGIKSGLSAIRAKRLYRKFFDAAFVAGLPQRRYAEKMGFPPERVYEGFYTADVDRFSAMKNKNFDSVFPKRFVFVGRYLPFKGIHYLWKAFSEIQRDDWELHCYGTGAEWEKRRPHPRIFHHGFVQPTRFDEIIAKGGIFVLPSLVEPWGVVVHEFASAGFPLLLSTKVNSASQFLEKGVNGFLFKSGNTKALRTAMENVMEIKDEDLRSMAVESKARGERVTIENWVETVEKITKTEL